MQRKTAADIDPFLWTGNISRLFNVSGPCPPKCCQRLFPGRPGFLLAMTGILARAKGKLPSSNWTETRTLDSFRTMAVRARLGGWSDGSRLLGLILAASGLFTRARKPMCVRQPNDLVRQRDCDFEFGCERENAESGNCQKRSSWRRRQ
jgi:hypothetical protein